MKTLTKRPPAPQHLLLGPLETTMRTPMAPTEVCVDRPRSPTPVSRRLRPLSSRGEPLTAGASLGRSSAQHYTIAQGAWDIQRPRDDFLLSPRATVFQTTA